MKQGCGLVYDMLLSIGAAGISVRQEEHFRGSAS